jgi:hypothetical protein
VWWRPAVQARTGVGVVHGDGESCGDGDEGRAGGGVGGWGSEVLTAALTDDVLVGCTAGGCAQGAATPLFMACQNSHVEVVKLLLADSDVLVNQATKVRRRSWLRERGQGGRAGAEGGSPHSCQGWCGRRSYRARYMYAARLTSRS